MLKIDDLNGVHGRFRKLVKIIDPSTRLLERKKGKGPLRVSQSRRSARFVNYSTYRDRYSALLVFRLGTLNRICRAGAPLERRVPDRRSSLNNRSKRLLSAFLCARRPNLATSLLERGSITCGRKRKLSYTRFRGLSLGIFPERAGRVKRRRGPRLAHLMFWAMRDRSADTEKT